MIKAVCFSDVLRCEFDAGFLTTECRFLGFWIELGIIGFTFAFWVEIVVKYHPYIGVLPGMGPGC